MRDGTPAQAAFAREQLILHNQRLVYKIAQKAARPAGVDIEDVAQVGMIGLFTAVDKFDPERGFKMSTYATWWIRQAIQRAYESWGSLIRIPNDVRRAALAVHDDDDLLELPDRVQHAVHLFRTGGVMSLDEQMFGDEGTGSFLDVLVGGDSEDDALAALKTNNVKGLVDAALAKFTEREREWFWLAYPMDGSDPMTLAAIGKRYGVSGQRVSSRVYAMRTYLAKNLDRSDLGLVA